MTAVPDRFDTRWRSFDDLSPRELHALLELRQRVFVLEQTCLFADIDCRDPDARHLLAFVRESGDRESGILAGCARLFGPSDGEGARIGRIAVAPPFRSTGLGGWMIGEALRVCAADWPAAPVELSAQAHLVRYYARFGFEAVSDEYDEDGIPHVDMRKGK